MRQKKAGLIEFQDQEELSDELRLLRKNLEEFLIVSEDGQISVEAACDLLVPKLYKMKELEDLLIKASEMRDGWFVRSDGKYMILNMEILNLKVQKKDVVL